MSFSARPSIKTIWSFLCWWLVGYRVKEKQDDTMLIKAEVQHSNQSTVLCGDRIILVMDAVGE